VIDSKNSAFTTVGLPQPLGPTTATISPALTLKLTPVSTGASALEAKASSLKVNYTAKSGFAASRRGARIRCRHTSPVVSDARWVQCKRNFYIPPATPLFTSTLTSTRRLSARPSAVSLGAAGSAMPMAPGATMCRSGTLQFWSK
jgi:hypothetical protein